MERLKASVQYGDWEGTAAADGFHSTDFSEYLRDNHLINENEFLLAISFYAGEHGFISVRALVLEKDASYDSVKSFLKSSHGPLKLREISVDVSMEKFFTLFKRFSVVLTWRGLDLRDREYYTD